MWVGSITGSELSRTSGGPATLCILPACVAARAGSEDGGFAGRKAGRGNVEYEAKLSGRHVLMGVVTGYTMNFRQNRRGEDEDDGLGYGENRS